MIVIVSDGGDTTSNKGLLEALTQAQKSDAIIFAVFTGNPWPSQNLRDLAAERALESLTRETGGEVLKPKLPLGRNGSRHGEEADDLSLKELDRAFARPRGPIAHAICPRLLLDQRKTRRLFPQTRRANQKARLPRARKNWLLRA